jgi:hypothetical protein
MSLITAFRASKEGQINLEKTDPKIANTESRGWQRQFFFLNQVSQQ